MSEGTIAVWAFGLGLLVLFLMAAAQGGLIYIDRARLRHLLEAKVRRAQALAELLDEPTSTAATIMLLHTLALAASAAGAFWYVLTWWPVTPGIAVGIAIVGFLLILLAQFLGRLLAIARPERMALTFVRPIEWASSLFRPLLWVLIGLEKGAARVLGLKHMTTPADAEERLRHLMDDDVELEEDEREMIASVIELADLPVREVMVPRLDVKAVPSTATVRDVVTVIVESGHSRIPVYEQSIDNIVGIVYAKDLLRHLRDGSQDVASLPLARDPYFVPETKKVDELLHEMQEKRVHLAVVVDEYGGTAGIITIEDLIEEIVGEIRDEYDLEEASMQRLSPTEVVVDARVSLRDVNDALDLHLEDEEFDTIGGLLYHHLGKVPTVDDEVRVNGSRVTVLSTNGRRVQKVKITTGLPPEEETPPRNEAA